MAVTNGLSPAGWMSTALSIPRVVYPAPTPEIAVTVFAMRDPADRAIGATAAACSDLLTTREAALLEITLTHLHEHVMLHRVPLEGYHEGGKSPSVQLDPRHA